MSLSIIPMQSDESFSATFTQVGAKTVLAVKTGKLVTLNIPLGTVASASAAAIASGATDVPAHLRPAASISVPCVVTDNNVKVLGRLIISAAGALTFAVGAAGANFTAAQPAGMDALSVTYPVPA